MPQKQSGAALMEFALAWPIVLTLVLGAVQLSVWASETGAARGAALAGARAGSVSGATTATAAQVARRALAAGLVGVEAQSWCPGAPTPAPMVWVCAREDASEITVEVGGAAP